ncbi:hypothetical protein RJT34_33253 [Clitoria ternatea]|uniref:Protein NBR1 homolog n=1 Tax=Clitoria ternatea TaxID=43366 RepID=A0AAN9IA94_CLITE
MKSSLVIKVQHGDILRRFTVQADENNRLDLDMAGLRAKIFSIFNFTADANLILRYIDEDGDLVTLVDDDDLHDVMRQQLKFLKINVHINNDSDSKSNAGKVTPAPLLGGAGNVRSSLPEPIHEALSKLSLNGASASHVAVSLADSILKVGQSVLNSHFQPHEPCREFLSNLTQFKAASSNQLPANLADLISMVIQSIPTSQVVVGPSSTSVPKEPISEARSSQPPSADPVSNTSQKVEVNSIMKGVDSASNSQQVAGNIIRGARNVGATPVDLNVLPCDPCSSHSSGVNRGELSSAVPDGDGKKGKMSTDDSLAGKGKSSGASSSSGGSRNSSTHAAALGSGAFFDCPFSGTCTVKSGTAPLQIPSFKRSHSQTEAMTGMFHKGVRCDGCGVFPITGPRFKSKVKENYDLCSICFIEMGNVADYIRMDRPSYGHHVPSSVHGQIKNFPTLPPHVLKKGSIKHGKPKLDSQFILDVNVIDGTMMAPSTAFTKIWRMRNNGTLVWPQGTQLVWIGGNMFSYSHSVDLEVPEDGVPVGKEIDVAVDFRAPPMPGRYLSYWRMASPSGYKFGQRVWVLVQVDASLKDSFYDSSQGLNVSGSKGAQVIDINVQPIEDDTLQTHIPTAPAEPVNQIVDKEPRPELENEISVREATFVGPAAASPGTSVSYPIIDLSETAPAVPTNQQSSNVDVPASSQGIDGINSVEENLLKELEEMGFKQVDLNKEILRINEYDLEQSVEDLCGVFEWDPILEELQEMGFRDNEVNKRLLKKNNGSIKRVVMDLINGE